MFGSELCMASVYLDEDQKEHLSVKAVESVRRRSWLRYKHLCQHAILGCLYTS